MDEVCSVWNLHHAAGKEYRMRKFGMNNVIVGLNNVIASAAKQSLLAIFLSIALAACGGDSGTSAPSDEDSSSSSTKAVSSSSVILSSSEGSSQSKSSSSVKKESSSSVKIASSSSSSTKAVSSSSVKTISSSSSVILSSSEGSSSSKQSSSSSKEIATSSSSSRNDVSSSSEYVPFDHSKTLAEGWRVGGEGRYKQFTDPRNGRSYYYIKIIGENSSWKKDSVTIMAENLNIGEMVLGTDNQNDDANIERYCYNNDTTICDEFGGLYQWAEMMQLPSRCNTESCADLIQENHRGICPEGWRLMTYEDFYIAWHAETNEYGIRGTRSSYGFGGNNYSGLSLTGAGLRMSEGGFESLIETFFWAYPQEHSADANKYVRTGSVSSFDDGGPSSTAGGGKNTGRSVRCVKLE